MKKIFTFMMMLSMGWMTAMAECQDGPYGLQINGNKVVDAPKFGDADPEGRVQYKASCVALQAGDVVKLINQSCGDTWMINLDPYGDYANFEGGKEAGMITCKVAGSYDFYIKLSMAKGDLIYVELGKDCGGQGGGENPGGQGGGDNPGGQGGSQGGVTGNPRYYYKGYIDNQDVEPSESTLFDHGMAELEVSENAYIFILYQVDGYPGEQYMTASYTDGVTHATMLKTGGEKFHIGAGTYTLYLYDNGDGTLEVSTEPMPGKKLADPQPLQAINNTEVSEKAHKVMVDGQLRIVRGDKMFDATGREL